MEIQTPKFIGLGLVLGLSLIISAAIGSLTFYQVRTFDNTLSVTGSAKRTVRADSAKWSAGISRIVTIDNLKTGYGQMANDLKIVKAFFKDNGVAETSLDISPVFVEQQFNYGSNTNAPKEYMLRQTIEYQVKDVDKIAALAKNTQGIVDQGVIFSPNAPEYYFTKLPETRIDLLGDAVRDAQARAQKIAESSGKQVGSLKDASVGVTQLVPVNSTEVADYGMYDTTKIDKEVSITVKTSFNLR